MAKLGGQQRGDQLEIIKYLHKSGADIMARDNYAVRWAAQNGRTDVVKYLQANM